MFLHSSDIQGTCATSGDGLYEGLSWLKQELTQKQIKTAVKKPLVETKDCDEVELHLILAVFSQ